MGFVLVVGFLVEAWMGYIRCGVNCTVICKPGEFIHRIASDNIDIFSCSRTRHQFLFCQVYIFPYARSTFALQEGVYTFRSVP